MKEKTLLLLWLAPVFSLPVCTFGGRMDLTLIQKLQNNHLFLARELTLPCPAVLEGPPSILQACVNWLSLALCQVETTIQMPEHTVKSLFSHLLMGLFWLLKIT